MGGPGEESDRIERFAGSERLGRQHDCAGSQGGGGNQTEQSQGGELAGTGPRG
jgi:hypothetical protein